MLLNATTSSARRLSVLATNHSRCSWNSKHTDTAATPCRIRVNIEGKTKLIFGDNEIRFWSHRRDSSVTIRNFFRKSRQSKCRLTKKLRTPFISQKQHRSRTRALSATTPTFNSFNQAYIPC